MARSIYDIGDKWYLPIKRILNILFFRNAADLQAILELEKTKKQTSKKL
jgi:hypothetical protein